MLFRDIPSDELCCLVNTALWRHFQDRYLAQEARLPNSDHWSESDAVQWLDRIWRPDEAEHTGQAQFHTKPTETA
jgi:hypothetical protein